MDLVPITEDSILITNRIDSHQHFWLFDEQRDQWITEDMSVIRKDFLPEDLAPILDVNQIGGCVAVQAVEDLSDNDFLLELARENDFIKGIVGWLDFTSTSIEKELEYYSRFSIIKGWRYVLQGNPQRDMMLTDNFRSNIGLLTRYNYTYDLLLFPDQLGYAAQLVESFPKQKFVLDHIGKPDLKNGDFENWANGIKALAKHENVFCKVSGMVTEADWSEWEKADYKSVLDVVTAAFGMDRLMFGSDWPVCQLAASYYDMKTIVEDYFSKFSQQEKENFFGGNAIRFYNL
ncbi:MAG: amidohydrolase [Pseudopedobacter saltans]|uniref:Amidohydrolase n=1 Tax=Pseudopedobacter saltans TaxID=151895 RepID=A0A2W5H4Y3_9SPHI|nr:MAG: amidohydrolase [Pseudopedobacter saltans]